MIVRPRHSWFRLLFVWQGSVLPRIMPRLAIVFAISLLSALANSWWSSRHAQSSLNIYIFTLMGVSLAIFLSFRNSVSYDRFWEARKLWGVLLIASRNISSKLMALTPDNAAARQLAYGCCALVYALKGQLRRDDISHHLERLLPPDLCGQLKMAQYKPAVILAWLQQLNACLLRDGQIDNWQWQSIDRNLDTMSEAMGGCERLVHTPIPYTYRVLLNRTVTIYCMLLPIGLTTSIGWLTPFIAVFMAYTYLAVDVLGEELEEPFGKEGNDLPLSALCHSIETSVREILGEEMPIAKPKPVGIYLY